MRYPISVAQRRVWAIDQLADDPVASHLCHASWLDGQVDTVALQRAMDVLVARHAALRTSVVSSDGWPEQVVADTGQVPIEVVLADGPDRAELLAVELAGRPFDLARGPLLRAALINVTDQRSLFVLAAHRIIADDAALAILLDELSTVYKDAAAPLPPLWLDYGDYAVWQRERLRGEELGRQLDHWHEPLRDAPADPTLPADHPRTGAASAQGALITASIDPTATRQLAAAAGTDLSTVVLTAYAVVLARYARQADLVIGVPVTGRIRVELEPIVGPFADTVPVRISLGDTTFGQLLDQVRDVSAAARSHGELPLDMLTEELGIDPVGRAARFTFGPPTTPALDLPGVTVGGRIAFPVAVASDLDLTASDDGTLTLAYRTDARLADRFLRSVVTVLEHAGQAPQTLVVDLPLLTAADSAALTAARPAPPTTFDVLRSLQESTATVTDGAATVALSTVCDRAARLARTLADHGVGPGTRVGVCFDRGIGMLTALLGVWWAGGAIVALEPELPLPRLEIMARAADLRLVLADDDHTGLAGSLGLVVVTPGDVAEPLDPVSVPADAVAYTVFTSGPTGPVGVDITRGALANVLAVGHRDLGLGRGDRFVAVTTAAFDIALWELLLPLVCGADLVIAAADDTGDADRLRSLIERHAATAMHAPPHIWRLLRDGVPESLRLRLCGGRPPRDLAAPDTVLWQLYGHPETTMWTAAGVVTPGEGPVAIGPAIDHTRVYVLDDRLVPVPVGVVGEVHIAGVGVAPGEFRPDPWATEPGGRMYATGDLGRWRAEGGLELVGRTDRRVMIRGVLVDCGEVEAALRAHHTIADAAVVGVPRADETALVAYVVSDSDGPELRRVVRPHLLAALPEAMVPTLVALPALPRTASGDVDHAALPAPEWAVTQGVPPRNPVEATMATIWAELLRATEPIGVHDNLFTLGTGSLAAIRFAARIADTYGVQLPMHRVIATPTIAALAEIVSADLNANQVNETDGDAELAALSDDELDDLLRAVLAARDRRRATRSDGQ